MNQQNLAEAQSIGKIILLYEQGNLLFGQVCHIADSILEIRISSGEMMKVRLPRIALFSSESYEPELDLFAFENSLSELSLPPLPAELFPADFETLFVQLETQDDAHRFALFVHLRSDSRLYYLKKGRYFQRNAEEQALYEDRELAKSARAHYLNEIERYLTEGYDLAEDMRKLFIRDIRAIQRGERVEDTERIIRKAKCRAELSTIRSKLGDTLPTADPVLAASGLPISFFDDETMQVKEADELPEAEHTAFTIDEDESKDFDDAISISEQDGGYILGIHVSNPAFYFDMQSPAFVEAIERVSSLYLPVGIVPMLPAELSDDRFSLNKSGSKAVLSLYVHFDAQLRISSWEVKAQKIQICENFSFSKIEKTFEDSRLRSLQKITLELKKERETADKSEDKRFYYSLSVKNGEIKAIKKDMHSPARLMIEELMVLYNRYMAIYAQNHEIPVLYRNISQYTDPQSKKQSNTAYLDTCPGYHPGIGTNAYLHATSPLRRAVDIINQMQIYRRLTAQTPYFDEDALQKLIPKIEKRLLLIRETLHKSERYWFLRFLEKYHLGSPLQGEIRAFSKGKLRVEIQPWGKQATIALESFSEAEHIHFIIYEVDFEKMLLNVDLIG